MKENARAWRKFQHAGGCELSLLQRRVRSDLLWPHFSSFGHVYRNGAARHFRLKATQHVVHWLGVELVAYS
jgi:hypothetical protein